MTVLTILNVFIILWSSVGPTKIRELCGFSVISCVVTIRSSFFQLWNPFHRSLLKDWTCEQNFTDLLVNWHSADFYFLFISSLILAWRWDCFWTEAQEGRCLDLMYFYIDCFLIFMSLTSICGWNSSWGPSEIFTALLLKGKAFWDFFSWSVIWIILPMDFLINFWWFICLNLC